jgi:alkanesulfonate monooxygenase
MTLGFHWFLPTYGDSRYIGGGQAAPAGAAIGNRPPSLKYLGQIARSAEQLGFISALTPTGAWCEDAWVTTAMLVEVTESLKFLVAFRPGLITPTLAAQMAASYQNFSNGRLLLNVVVGGEAREQRSYGDYLSKDSRYARADEFLSIVTALWRGGPVDHDGTHYKIEGATLLRLPFVVPPLFLGGSSDAAGPVAARHTDVYLTWGEPPKDVAGKIAWISRLAAAEGRQMKFGIRLHVIARDTTEAAWSEANRLLSAVNPETIKAAQDGFARSESVGQARMVALHKGEVNRLEIAPNLWAGFGLVRGGAGTALVGSHQEVADRIEEYAALGISEFILSGVPHLEEAYWFGEGVLPILQKRNLWRHPQAGQEVVQATQDIPFLPAAEQQRIRAQDAAAQ